MKTVYLDYAAATPMADEVASAMAPYFTEHWHNPSALYLAARQVKQSLDQARADIAHWLGTKPAEVIFTAGATEANMLAVSGLLVDDDQAEIVVSATEHEAVLASAQTSGRAKIAPVQADGVINLQSLEQLIGPKTVLVSIHYANNETGVIQPLKSVAKLVAAERKRRQAAGGSRPIYFHTDASQAAQYLDLHTNRLGVDMMTISAGKIYGPKQVAVLYIRGGIKLTPLIRGGGQERGLRSGTENVAGAVGLAKALNLVQANRHQEAERVAKLRDEFESKLTELPSVEFSGSRRHRLPNFSHLTIAGIDGERLVMELDEDGVQAATGAACSANSDQPSHVLKAMGLAPEAVAGSIRFSLGCQTTKADLNAALKSLKSRLA